MSEKPGPDLLVKHWEYEISAIGAQDGEHVNGEYEIWDGEELVRTRRVPEPKDRLDLARETAIAAAKK